MKTYLLASFSATLALAASASPVVTVINPGLQPGMSVPSGVTLNNVMTTNLGHTPNNLALLTTTGTASGLSLTASSAGYAIGAGGSFSPIGSVVYDNSSSIINDWIADYQTPYGTIWQGGTNSSSTGQTMNLTLTGLTAFTDYSITLLSARGNTFPNIAIPGTIGFTYGGSTTGVTTAFQGTGTLADTTLSMTTSAGNASGLNAREITWTFTTGTTPQNAVIALTGAWNVNSVIISATLAEPFANWATSGEVTGVTFDGDANGDGVKDGLAFLLGAANPSENAIGRLPTVTQSGGALMLNFNCLPLAARGTATLKLAHSSDLGILDPWTATTAVVPDTTNAVPDNNVTFEVGAGPAGPPALNSVTATIDSAAAAGGKLFGRLEATQP